MEAQKSYQKLVAEIEAKAPTSSTAQTIKKFLPAMGNWARLEDLGNRIIRMAADLEAGKPINPKTLKKIGGQVKWWATRLFHS
jgi:hypothetical protein